MEHSFDIEIAKQYGIHEAVILKTMQFWIKHNIANGRNFHDGCYWTYNSRKSWGELFPYLTIRQINYALGHLIDDGIIKTGNYNEDGRDRTLWYALTDQGCKLLGCEMQITKLSNANDKIVKALPDNKPTDTIKENNNINVITKDTRTSRFVKPTVAEIASYCAERGNGLNAQKIYDYYESKGWVIGKNSPMKDWKASIRTWENNNFNANNNQVVQQQQRPVVRQDIERASKEYVAAKIKEELLQDEEYKKLDLDRRRVELQIAKAELRNEDHSLLDGELKIIKEKLCARAQQLGYNK